MKKKVVIGIVIAAAIALMVWVIPLAPQKDVIVTTKEIPLTADERAQFGYEQEALTMYCVYYVWDGEQEEYPWWSIFQSPYHEFEWIVLETCDIGNLNDTDSFIKAVESASRFDENWFDHDCRCVQRTRLEKLQHALFGGGDAFEKERIAINQILLSIHSGEE